METVQTLHIVIEKSAEGSYIPVPLELGSGIERIDVYYAYPQYRTDETGDRIARIPEGVIDLALLGPEGGLAGASGSDRDHIWVSPLGSAAGFERRSITPGRWTIIAGAYRVPAQGIKVEYRIVSALKTRRLFKGDTHLHTAASDGSGGAEETAALARQLGLDFIFITDHNSHAGNGRLPEVPGLTVLPGCEWTHYQGHAGLLGVARPFEGTYVTANHEETAALLGKAQSRGALVTINHPFCPLVPWRWGFDLPFDAVEVWNGIMSERNERAAAWWQERLCAGARLPITGGSDYHRPGILGSIAMPCHCVWAPSREREDIMAALRRGSGYISYLPDGPGLDVLWNRNGEQEGCLGAEIPGGSALEFRFFGLQGGDTIRLITPESAETIPCPPDTLEMTLRRVYTGALFVRAEVYRRYAPGLPPMKALLSNPVYFL